ncbi:hypothetical protein [Streptomyces sp. NPDC101166]|uniref:hypothetical protein n=1 Tax=Streptomyces sp. NPDC101166 TaxID=3366120 RepID=UPI003826387F
MRIRLSDGLREVEIECEDPVPQEGPTPDSSQSESTRTTRTALDELGATAVSLLRAVAPPERDATKGFGFTADVSLDSHNERSTQDEFEGDVE